jgi:peptide/nickel transport system substrate-binding protein
MDSDGDEVLDKNGHPFRISIIYEKGVLLEEQIATRIKIDWNKIGIDVVRIPLFKHEIKKALSQKNYDVILMNHLFEETIESFESFFHYRSDENILNYRSRSVDRLIDLYKRQESTASQNVMFQAIQKHINEDHPAAFLFFVWVERYVVNSKKFTNFRNSNGVLLPFTEWKFNK